MKFATEKYEMFNNCQLHFGLHLSNKKFQVSKQVLFVCLCLPTKNINLIINTYLYKTSSTYFLSICAIFISIECIVVKTFVAPCTTHSRVSGMAIGVHVAKNTGSLRLQSGRNDK